jgi:hypothetical protein
MMLLFLTVVSIPVGFLVGWWCATRVRERSTGAGQAFRNAPVVWRMLQDDDEELSLTLGTGTVVFRGSGTVWHEYPSGRRATTLEEADLAEVAVRERWKLEQQ